MKLNNDCLRDVLLYLENCDYYILNEENGVESRGIWFAKICENFTQYSKPEIYYTLSNLEQAGFIDLYKIPSCDSLDCRVNFITFYGHEFLNSIRHESTWNKTKEIAGKVGNFSLETLGEIAKNIAATAITTALQPLL